jgi:DNA primase
VDIVEVISRHVALKPSGTSFKGLCPFHDEKSPSFHVHPGNAVFVCYGCGAKGSVINFVMKHQRLGFLEAVRELAREANIALPESGRPAEDDGRGAAAIEALAFAARFYRAVLHRETGRAALDYLRRRGISDATIEEFGLGYAPDEWEGLRKYALGKGFTDEALFDAGLVRRRDDGRPYDMFRGRVLFPIHDARGRVIGFGARTLGEDQPKYLNSPEGPLFHKGRELYAAHFARPAALRAGRVVVVEGYTDVILCHQAGMREVVAGLGTALTPENARVLRRFGVPVTLLYDGDEAGLRAAERAAAILLAESVGGSVALLPGEQDPADLVKESGIEPLRAVLGSSRDLFEYCVGRVVERHDLNSLEGRAGAGRELLPVVGAIADPMRRDVAFKLLSERLGVSESTLRDSLPREKRRSAPAEPGADRVPAPPAPPAWVAAERDFLAAAITDVAIWDEIAPAHPPSRFRDPALREAAETVDRLARACEPVTRERLLSLLAASDAAAAAVESLEPGVEAVARARRHLDYIRGRTLLDTALPGKEPLDAVVAARRRSMETGTNPT